MIFIAMNKKEIGTAIVERRDELRITQARLARVSGVSVHTLSNLETGDGNVTLDTLIKVATTIGYKIKVGVLYRDFPVSVLFIHRSESSRNTVILPREKPAGSSEKSL